MSTTKQRSKGQRRRRADRKRENRARRFQAAVQQVRAALEAADHARRNVEWDDA